MHRLEACNAEADERMIAASGRGVGVEKAQAELASAAASAPTSCAPEEDVARAAHHEHARSEDAGHQRRGVRITSGAAGAAARRHGRRRLLLPKNSCSSLGHASRGRRA